MSERRGRIDGFLARVGAALHDPDRRAAVIGRIPVLLRRLLWALFLAYALALAVLLPVVRAVGERNLATAFALYLPPLVWLVPPLLLLFPALLLSWRLSVVIVASSALFVWGCVDWEHPAAAPEASGPELTIMTFNRGQQGGSLQPFKNSLRPDIIAMQEAGNRAGSTLASPEYTEFSQAKDLGEFMLLSRYPITDSGLLSFEAEGERHTVAAWFAIDFAGTPIIVYNVHLPTPRDALAAIRRGAALWGILGFPGSPFEEKREYYQRFWDRQIELAGQLDAHVRRESRPYLLVGDFNAPAPGVVYREFAEGRIDAHERAGSGFGFTFPGVTRNPLSLFGPWLRIDHIFAGPGWQAVACETEERRASQHLAVAATFVLETPEAQAEAEAEAATADR